MIFLVVDLETSDLPKPDLPPTDPNQPWIVQVAAQLRAESGETLDHFCTRILADGRQIRAGAQKVHGISTREAGRGGVNEVTALGMLIGFAKQATHVIAHGAEFERLVVASNLARMGKDASMWLRPGLQFLCTMKAATPFCHLPGKGEGGSFKWPSLDEAVEILLGLPPRPGEHDAWDDLELTWPLFLALRSRGAFDLAA